MANHVTVDQVMQLARDLSPLEKLKVIERLAPNLAEELAPIASVHSAGESQTADEVYQAGYEKLPEDIGDIEALLPHLPLATERWE